MKLISWNIDSLNAALLGSSARALLSQDVLNTIIQHNPEVIALQKQNYQVMDKTKTFQILNRDVSRIRNSLE